MVLPAEVRFAKRKRACSDSSSHGFGEAKNVLKIFLIFCFVLHQGKMKNIKISLDFDCTRRVKFILLEECTLSFLLFAQKKRNKENAPSPEEFFAFRQKPLTKLRALKSCNSELLLRYSAEKGHELRPREEEKGRFTSTPTPFSVLPTADTHQFVVLLEYFHPP